MNKANLNAFYTIADIAATKWYQSKCSYWRVPTWAESAKNHVGHYKGFTFRSPNFGHPTGYWTFLTYIADHEGGVKRRELCEAFNLKSVSMTTDTLRYADLITLDSEYTHKFTVTPFGRAYIALAKLAEPELTILRQAKELRKI